MTDEQIRLYAIARLVAPNGTRIRTIAERAAGGTLYTIEMKTPGAAWPERWFAVHSNALRDPAITDTMLMAEVRRAMGPPPALPAPQG